MRLFLLLSLFISLSFALTSCFLDGSVVPKPPHPMEWSVEPQYFCPGDDVAVKWDLSQVDQDPKYCRSPNGGYESLLSCSTNSDCPDTHTGADGICYDGNCCSKSLFDENRLWCESEQGCYPAFNFQITAAPTDLSPPVRGESRSIRGGRVYKPTETTDFRFAGSMMQDPAIVFDDSKRAVMVVPDPETNILMPFRFSCYGGQASWETYNTEETTSENVVISGVRNTTRHVIILSNSLRSSEPVVIAPGETVSDFNGTLGGLWTVGLSPLDPASRVVPRCSATDIQNPWPDLPVEILLSCRVP